MVFSFVNTMHRGWGGYSGYGLTPQAKSTPPGAASRYSVAFTHRCWQFWLY
jgi:hypothetical protein